MRRRSRWRWRIFLGALVACTCVFAAPANGSNGATRFALIWARGYHQWAQTHKNPTRITEIICKKDGTVAVACKAVFRDDTSGAKTCIGVVLGTSVPPGDHTPILGHENLPAKLCGIGQPPTA